MSPVPLRVTVISAEHINDLPKMPIVSRSPIPDPPETISYVLDEPALDTDFWTVAWGANLIARLQSASVDNSVGYVVPGHPMLGDATMQFLLNQETAGTIELELFDEPVPVVLTDLLGIAGGSPAFIDLMTLLDIERQTPFNAGALPFSSVQTSIVTNVVPASTGQDLQRILTRRFRPDTDVRLIPMTGEPEQFELKLSELGDEPTQRPCYLVLPAATGDEFQRGVDDLQRLVARLRAPGGCPWDREQTSQSLGRNLIEESYELLDAIESGNAGKMREELGDFLLQALMHAQITEEEGGFRLEDVVDTLIAKLVRRHPHVFAQADVSGADGVVQSWDEIKRAERAARSDEEPPSVLGDIPTSLPALLRAQSVIKRSSRSELAVEDIESVSYEAYGSLESDTEREVVADLLHAIQQAQEHGVDTENALRAWTLAFERILEGRQNRDVSTP